MPVCLYLTLAIVAPPPQQEELDLIQFATMLHPMGVPEGLSLPEPEFEVVAEDAVDPNKLERLRNHSLLAHAIIGAVTAPCTPPGAMAESW
jgi:hypothetical protein